MMASHSFPLDRWLICSAPAFESLTNFWRDETGRGSLLDWRMANGAIEHVAPGDIDKRFDSFDVADAPHINIVVDRADTDILQKLEARCERFDIQLVEWRNAPLAAVLSMNAPDKALQSRLCEPVAHPAPDWAVRPKSPAPKGYEACLVQWEHHCRANDSTQFAAAYPEHAAAPIPWTQLLSEIAEGQSAPVAANDNWIELQQLAAATKGDAANAISLEDPSNSPAQWKLTVSPIDGGPATLVVFRANDTAVAAFAGCRIKLRIDKDIIELGQIDEDGQAEIILPQPIELKRLAISWNEVE